MVGRGGLLASTMCRPTRSASARCRATTTSRRSTSNTIRRRCKSHIEEIEELLDHALGIGWGDGLGTEFDTDNLLRMDSTTLITAIRDAVGAGVMSPNEGRGKLDLKPVDGRRVAVSAAAELFSWRLWPSAMRRPIRSRRTRRHCRRQPRNRNR